MGIVSKETIAASGGGGGGIETINWDNRTK